jgi:thiol:disulfide interchange protein DsbC
MIRSVALFVFFLLLSSPALAFQKEGCGGGSCTDCHALTKQEASALLKDKVSEVLDVQLSEIPGLWDIEAMYQGNKIPLYLDFSKNYLISGNVIKLDENENLTEKKFIKMNKVDVSAIPLKDAVVLGDPKAARKIIVFDDPECSFCRRLHPELEKVAAEHSDIAIFVKMYPLPSHPSSYPKAKAVVCAALQGDNERAASLLSDALQGKQLPAPDCETDQLEQNIALVRELRISSTPTLVMPDGRVLPGYKTADHIVAEVEAGK